MRTFGFVLLVLVVGLVAGYAAAVAVGSAWMRTAGAFDRDGVISTRLALGLGPLGGIVSGVIAGGVTFAIIRRRKRLVASGARPPVRRWPLATRAVVAALAWGVGTWLAVHTGYWLTGPIGFASHTALVVASYLPLVAPLVTAALAASFVLWRRVPRQIDP